MALSEADKTDILFMGPNTIRIKFEKTLDMINDTTNLCALADLAQYAGALWAELQSRGVGLN